jgi:hypothetical protein
MIRSLENCLIFFLLSTYRHLYHVKQQNLWNITKPIRSWALRKSFTKLVPYILVENTCVLNWLKFCCFSSTMTIRKLLTPKFKKKKLKKIMMKTKSKNRFFCKWMMNKILNLTLPATRSYNKDRDSVCSLKMNNSLLISEERAYQPLEMRRRQKVICVMEFVLNLQFRYFFLIQDFVDGKILFYNFTQLNRNVHSRNENLQIGFSFLGSWFFLFTFDSLTLLWSQFFRLF